MGSEKKTKNEKKEIKKVMKTDKKTVAKKVTKVSSVSKTAKAEVKVSKPVVKKMEAKVKESKTSEDRLSLKAAVFGIDGVSKGSISLPEEVFGITPNKSLIAQAVRVYLANQRQGNASVKTRGEVVGSTKKIYRQKGTGRARHGAAKAPIFVGGGIAHGPKPHDFSMDLPKKMRRKALISALSQKAQDGSIRVVDGEFSGKTKEVAKLLQSLDLRSKGKNLKTLFVIDENKNAMRGAHNIDNLLIENVATLSTYGVISTKNIIFMKSSIGKITERLSKN